MRLQPCFWMQQTAVLGPDIRAVRAPTFQRPCKQPRGTSLCQSGSWKFNFAWPSDARVRPCGRLHTAVDTVEESIEEHVASGHGELGVRGSGRDESPV